MTKQYNIEQGCILLWRNDGPLVTDASFASEFIELNNPDGPTRFQYLRDAVKCVIEDPRLWKGDKPWIKFGDEILNKWAIREIWETQVKSIV